MKHAVSVTLGLSLVGVAISLFVWGDLPDPMPTHWNENGDPDGFSPRIAGAFMLPAIAVLAAVATAFGTRLGPRREHLARSIDAIELVVVGTSAFLLSVHVLALRAAMSPDQRLETHALVALLGGLFVIIGQALAKMRSNFIAGIRTPWTLSSEAVWHRTHRFGSWVFTLGGVAIIVGSLMLPDGASAFWMVVIVTFVSSASCITYSAYAAQQEKRAELG